MLTTSLSFIDKVIGDFRGSEGKTTTISLVTAAGIAVGALTIATIIKSRQQIHELDYLEEKARESGPAIDQCSTRPSTVTPVVEEESSQLTSPIAYSNSAIPKSEGDLLFFRILESYSAASRGGSPELSSTSGSSTPQLPGNSGSTKSGNRKRRGKNNRKK